jgi:hypothetical protein
MPYTMADFRKDFVKEHFRELTPQEQLDALKLLSPEQRRRILQTLQAEERQSAEVHENPDQRAATASRKHRKKK